MHHISTGNETSCLQRSFAFHRSIFLTITADQMKCIFSAVEFLSVLDSCGLRSMKLELMLDSGDDVIDKMTRMRSLTHLEIRFSRCCTYILRFNEPLLQDADKLQMLLCNNRSLKSNALELLTWLIRRQPNPITDIVVNLYGVKDVYDDDGEFIRLFDFQQVSLPQIKNVEIAFGRMKAYDLDFIRGFLPRVSHAVCIKLCWLDFSDPIFSDDQFPLFVKVLLSKHYEMPREQTFVFRNCFRYYANRVAKTISDKIVVPDWLIGAQSWTCHNSHYKSLIMKAVGEKLVAVLLEQEAHVHSVELDYRGITLDVRNPKYPRNMLKLCIFRHDAIGPSDRRPS